MNKYLEFNEIDNTGRKTKKFYIRNAQTGDLIGEIYWRAGWRRYVSSIKYDIDIDSKCHKEIADFLDNLMEERKECLVMNRIDSIPEDALSQQNGMGEKQ